MPWQSFPHQLTVAGIPKAIVTVRPQPRRPRAGWAQCDPLVLRRVHPWWWVGPLTREEEFRAAPRIIDPLQDPVWCEGFVHTRFGAFQVSPDAFASAVEYRGPISPSEIRCIDGTEPRVAHRLRPGWRSTRMTLSVNSGGKEV